MASDKQDKVLNVPTLRFPEFSGEWKDIRLRELCKFLSGGTPSIDNNEYWEGDIPFVSAIAMHDTHIEKTPLHLTEKGVNNGSKQLKAGNLLLLVRGSMLWNKIPICYNDVDVAFNQDVKGIIPNNNTTSLFLLNWIQSHENRIKYMVTGTGIGAGKLDSEDLLALNVKLPSLVEQRKIEKFLSLIDERITTQNRIIEKLQSLITGLNDFLMDNPSWENVRVGDFMDFYSTNSLSWEQLDYNHGEVKNLHYGLIHSGLPTLIDCRTSSLPKIKDEFLPKQYTLCKDGDVAFADASEDTNEVGKAVEIIDCREQSIVCGLHTIHGRDKANATIVGFKGFAFNAKYFHNQLRRISQGSKIYSISTDNIKSCFLRIPPKSEQEKIVRLLSTYLQKIDVAEQTLKAYQIQKQYLLKTLFI